MNRLIYFSLIIVILLSCGKKEKDKSIVIDLTKNKDISIKEIFTHAEAFPLETTPLSFIKRIQKTVYKNHKYYIFDKDQNTLFVYNENGNYKDKIHRIGKGPGEYTEIGDFELNPLNNNIELLTRHTILIYDSLLNFKKTFTYTNNKIPVANYFKILSPDTTVFYYFGGQENVIFYSRNKKKVVSQYYERPDFITKKTLFNTMLSPFYQCDNSINMFDPSSNKIYSLTKDGFKMKYYWDFGKFTFDAALDLDRNKSTFYYKNVTYNLDKAYNFWFNIENKNFIITAFILGKSGTKFLIFNKNSSKYKVFANFIEGEKIPFYPSFPFFAGDDLVTFVDPGSKDIPKSLLDEQTFKTLTKLKQTDNPIIIKYHFNEEFLK